MLLLALAATTMSGCAPEPQPSPTPTPAFASEEEAFAAAEEVYRAYNEALNAIEPNDPRTFEDVYAFSSGTFAAADRENLSTMHAEGYTISGDAVVLSFTGEAAEEPYERVVATTCLDVSEVAVLDSSGASVVNPDRPPIYAIRLIFLATDEGLRIDSAERIEDLSCAS